MIDPFGREITYLRISVTDLCNLRCKYCMPPEGIDKVHHEDILSIEEIEEIAKTFVKLGVNKIRLTGGEPLLRAGILDIVERIGRLDGLKDFAITTNGTLLKRLAKDLKDRGLTRVNISLDSLDEHKYKEITRVGELKSVLEGIEAAKEVGLSPIKINTVLVGGFNDDEIEDLVRLTEREEVDVRFIELMPIGEASAFSEENFISSQIVLERLPELIPVPNKDLSSPAVYYKLPNGKGKIGLINPVSCKFCEYCNRVRLTAQGKLKLCLLTDDEVDLREVIRNGGNLEEAIIEAIKLKPESHNLESGVYISRNMYEIGG